METPEWIFLSQREPASPSVDLLPLLPPKGGPDFPLRMPGMYPLCQSSLLWGVLSFRIHSYKRLILSAETCPGMFCCLRANNSLFSSRWRRPQIKITNHKSVATVGPWKWGSVRSLTMMITMFNKVNRLTYGTMHRNMHQHLATSTVLLPLLPIKAVRTSTLPPPSIAPLRKRIAPLAPIWWLRGKSDVWWGTTSLYSLPDWVEGHSQ
jgi:hypothetical protein